MEKSKLEVPPYSFSRRRFLSTGMVTVAGLLVLREKILSTGKIVQADRAPGLFFSEGDVSRIRENVRHPLFKDFWGSLLHADIGGDMKFLREELDIHNHVAHLLRANEILKRSAFVALVDENRPHEEVAKLVIKKILSFNEWDYFLEGGAETIGLQRAPETTMAMSLAFDWLNHRLTADEKNAMLEAIGRKGVPPCYLTLYGMKYPERVKGWGFNPTSTYKLRFDLSRWPIILDKTNLKMIPIAGLTIGAVLLYERHPDGPKWLALARESLEKFADLYGKDGSYLEGISYWGYSTHHFVLAVEALKRMRGIDSRRLLNFSGTMQYALQMAMPSRNYPDDVVNFSDSAPSPDGSLGFWVAREFRDGIAQYTAQSLKSRRNLFALVWHDPSVSPEDPPPSLMDAKFEKGWIVSRSGWGIEDTVVAMRSGGPGNHEHADRNSIILKAYGERMLHDPYGAAYSHTEKHWLLRLTAAHTAVLVDGKGHQYHDGREGTNPSIAEAQVVQYQPGGELTVFTSDATHAYRFVHPDVRKIQRTVVFLKPDIVLLIDELEKELTPSEFQVRYQVFNVDGAGKRAVGVDGKTFRIDRPSVRLAATVAADVGFRILTGILDIPEDKGIFPYVEVSTEPTKRCTVITTCLLTPVPSAYEVKAELMGVDPGYEVHFSTKDLAGVLTLELKKDYPRVSLRK